MLDESSRSIPQTRPPRPRLRSAPDGPDCRRYLLRRGRSAPRRREGTRARRDARALAEACRSGTYRPAHRTSDERRDIYEVGLRYGRPWCEPGRGTSR